MSFWNDPLRVAADWLQGIFVGWGMNETGAHVLVVFLGVLLLIIAVLALGLVGAMALVCSWLICSADTASITSGPVRPWP